MASSRTITAVVAAALVTSGALAGCGPATDEPSADNDAISIAVTSISSDYDPRVFGMLFGMNQQAILEPLFFWDQANNEYDPVLATDWSISDDGLTTTMNLRDDVDFVDGTHMTAETVDEYLDALLSGGTYIFTPRIVQEYGTEVNAVGEYTLEITTTSPMAWPWFEHMSYTPIISPAVLDQTEELSKEPLGYSGAYEVVSQTPDVDIVLERRDDYWNEDAYPYQTITLKIFADQVGALNALRSGQVDAAQLNAQLAVEAKSAGLSIFEGHGMERMLWISDRGGQIVPALGDVRVRQAMNFAFDKEGILESIDLGFGTASSQPYLPVQDEFVEDGEDRYAFNLDTALDLMAEAGYEDGFALTIPSYSGLADVEPIVQQALSDINIAVTFEQFPDPTSWREAATAGIASGKYPVILNYDYPISLARDWLLPTGSWNGLGFRSPEVEGLLETIRTGAEDEKMDASQELGEFILEEAWFVPFSKPATTWATKEGVTMVVGDVNAIPLVQDFGPSK